MMEKIICETLSEILEKDIGAIVEHDIRQSLSDLGLDSLHFVKLVVKLEEHFCIEIDDSDLVLANFLTIESINKTLEKYVCKKTCVKKVVVTDCDDVLWRGVVGEEDIRIDSICSKYHCVLKKLQMAGVLICICSKNREEQIRNAFNDLDLEIKYSDFVAIRANDLDKTTNLFSIADELNISLSSFVFLDNSEYEIGFVSSLLPEIATIRVIEDDDSWLELLEAMFEITESSIDRTKMYLEQKNREKSKALFNNVEEYNKFLNTKLECRFVKLDDVGRICELSQRTNRFNLSARRYKSQELKDLLFNSDYVLLAFSANDMYGDMGIIGCVVIRRSCQVIEAFMLSCRAFGRGFENMMLEKIKELFPCNPIYGVLSVNEQNDEFSHFYECNGILLCDLNQFDVI